MFGVLFQRLGCYRNPQSKYKYIFAVKQSRVKGCCPPKKNPDGAL